MTNENSCKTALNKIFDCVHSGVNWTSSQIKSACPPKKKKGEKESSDEDKTDIEPAIPKKSPYVPPSQICPSIKPCCYIKMQDPCRPCCCETKPKPPPCPPRRGPPEPREPVCGCELCQKNPGNEKCCDKSRTFRGLTIDREYFEKA
ncbi:hypothetical protein ANTQUA_LOCUS775 [Anthophora quadrimaculata]